MLAAGVVAVVLVLGSRGEAPREMKFEGSLLASASSVQLNAGPLERRPTLTAPAVLLAVGGGLTLGGVGVILAAVFVARGWDALGFAMLGIAVGVSGLIMLTVGIIVLIVKVAARANFDQRMLREQEVPPPPALEPPPTVPTSVMRERQSAILIAQF